MSHQNEKAIEVIEEILKFLDIDVTIDVEERENSSDFIKLKSTDDSLIIGYHGNTLNSLQHIVNTILYKELGEGNHVVIDVANYRKEREDKILDVAENASEKAKFLGKSVSLYPMSAYERKIVHQRVSEIEGVRSESDGEGADRKVIIYLDE